MAARKKRKAVPEKSKAGRKKEIKRFEMAIWDHKASGDVAPVCNPNEIAFVVRTSGGTPLNPTDTGKLHRILQHELRRLGHKLKRKGQELDPEPETAKIEAPAPEADTSHADPSKDLDPAPSDQAWPSADDVKAPTADPALDGDADDSDAHNEVTTP